jgi:hypothetical protein
MKRMVLIGLALATNALWGQVPGERADGQPLCMPFVSLASDLLAFIERTEERGVIVSSNDGMRRVADATFQCAESDIRLWSHAEADTQLAEVERQFSTGTNTSAAVGAARVDAVKASYCEAAFAHVTQLAKNYDRRKQAGLTHPGADIAPILLEIEALVPVCGRSATSASG